MIIQVLSTSAQYRASLTTIFEKFNATHNFFHNEADFIESSIKLRPSVFFIQSDTKESLGRLNLVSDLKTMFGALSTIVLFGDKISRKKLASFLGEGADQFFSFPFDQSLIEDFIQKRVDDSFFKAFKYRNVPSGMSDVEIEFKVNLEELSEKGVILASSNLIKSGATIDVDLSEVKDASLQQVKARVLYSEKAGPNLFKAYCEYEDLSPKQKQSIVNFLKK